MIIFPDIEIQDGKCINLSRGGFGEPTVYDTTPLDAAREFERAGAKWLHIVDMDGVFQGGRHNADMICEIIETVNIPVQVAGGIRTIDAVHWWFEHGAERIVLGTAAVADQNLVMEACTRYPDRVVVSVDAHAAQSTIITENALPRPVVVTTLITSPTATSRIAVGIMMRNASRIASTHRSRFIGVFVAQETPITAKMANVAERTGVYPMINEAINTASGTIKCQPLFSASSAEGSFSSTPTGICRRLASMRTKNATVRKYSSAGSSETEMICR